MNGAIYVSNSGNTKLLGTEPADATYASIAATCPITCPLKDQGCYAQGGHVAITVARLDAEAAHVEDPEMVADAEADAIDAAYGGKKVPRGRALRLHVSGDSRTIVGTRLIAMAVTRWKKRGGGVAWTFTHAWRRVQRKHWERVSVLASIERPELAAKVRKQGYAPALVVDHHEPDGKAFFSHGVRWIPCPNQTRGIGCTDCRLCFDADALFARNAGIAFAAHGPRANAVKRRLTVLQGGK